MYNSIDARADARNKCACRAESVSRRENHRAITWRARLAFDVYNRFNLIRHICLARFSATRGRNDRRSDFPSGFTVRIVQRAERRLGRQSDFTISVNIARTTHEKTLILATVILILY